MCLPTYCSKKYFSLRVCRYILALQNTKTQAVVSCVKKNRKRSIFNVLDRFYWFLFNYVCHVFWNGDNIKYKQFEDDTLSLLFSTIFTHEFFISDFPPSPSPQVHGHFFTLILWVVQFSFWSPSLRSYIFNFSLVAAEIGVQST